MTGRYLRLNSRNMMKSKAILPAIVISFITEPSGRYLFLLRNSHMEGMSRMMFFRNVSQLVSTIASPKQPQSDTGFVRARTRVRGVNRDIIIITSQVP